MKSIFTTLVLGSLALAIAGPLAGCSDRYETTQETTRPDSSYKKTEVRDANGNLIEKKVETKQGN